MISAVFFYTLMTTLTHWMEMRKQAIKTLEEMSFSEHPDEFVLLTKDKFGQNGTMMGFAQPENLVEFTSIMIKAISRVDEQIREN